MTGFDSSAVQLTYRFGEPAEGRFDCDDVLILSCFSFLLITLHFVEAGIYITRFNLKKGMVMRLSSLGLPVEGTSYITDR